MNPAAATARPRPSVAHALAATLLMIGSLAAAWWLTPTRSWYDELGRPDLEQIVPRQFGDWVASDQSPAQLVSPELSETLRIIYAQTLSRLYVNRSDGRMIMLSIALGLDQTHATQLHHPEGCYRTQGFTIDEARHDRLESAAGPIKLTRFISHTAMRREPVTYWTRIGRKNARSWFEVNLERLSLAARGYVSDGLLFRVSEVSSDPVSSFQVQDGFINELISALTPAQRAALVGSTL